MLRKGLILLLCCSSFAAMANQLDVKRLVPNAELVGETRMQYLFWDVYDISLTAPEGEWRKDAPFALTLSYLMDLKGDDIAERSVEEMRGLGYGDEMKLAAWYSEMRRIFPNVKNGSLLTGLYNPGKPTKFYHNGKLAGEVRDPEFGKAFFGIWLDEKTSEPKLRQRLLGQK
jgi:hypothetical protein